MQTRHATVAQDAAGRSDQLIAHPLINGLISEANSHLINCIIKIFTRFKLCLATAIHNLK